MVALMAAQSPVLVSPEQTSSAKKRNKKKRRRSGSHTEVNVQHGGSNESSRTQIPDVLSNSSVVLHQNRSSIAAVVAKKSPLLSSATPQDSGKSNKDSDNFGRTFPSLDHGLKHPDSKTGGNPSAPITNAMSPRPQGQANPDSKNSLKKQKRNHSPGHWSSHQAKSHPHSNTLTPNRNAADLSATPTAQQHRKLKLLPRKHAAERKNLPVHSEKDKIVAAIKEHQTVVIVGETGSGKTTQIPQYLMESGLTAHGKVIAVTQPRRVAAITVARRVCEEVGTSLGDLVGYTIRFDDTTSPLTRLKFMTDGMLLREAMVDPTLSKYSVVVLDEAHERTLSTDILLGLMKRIQAARKDLKIVVMSATLDVTLFTSFFPGAVSLYVRGRQYPVDVFYTKEPQSDYLDSVLVTTLQIHLDEEDGDILVFLTGQEEIEAMQQLLKEYAAQMPQDLTTKKLLICPIYAALPSEEQLLVFSPAPANTRKVVLATNIAETSVTINGIRFVVDPGLVKVRSYNPRTGMDTLQIAQISRAQAQQRAGRAGREGPGRCYRLFQEAKYLEFQPSILSEIKRINLTTVVLTLKSMGIEDIWTFDFIDKPSKESLARALERLYALGALDDNGKLTDMGEKIARFPLDPSYSKLLLAAVELGCASDALTVVSMISVENIFVSPPKDKRQKSVAAKKRFAAYDGDMLTFLNVYKAYQQVKGDYKWCLDHFINIAAMKTALSIRQQLLDHFKSLKIEVDDEATESGKKEGDSANGNEPLLKALVAGLFLQCAKRQPAIAGATRAAYKCLTNGQLVNIHPSSSLFGRSPAPSCVIYNEVVLTTRQYMRGVTAIEAAWLSEMAPRFFSSKT